MNIFENFATLETDRLLLRKMRMSDAQDIFEYASNPTVVKYSIGDPHASLEESERYVSSVLEAYDNNIAGLWSITIKGAEKVVGTCGYEMWYSEHYRAEVGYSLAEELWGKGYMTEALNAMVYFSFTEMDLNRVDAICHVENEASLRVLEKAGFEREGLLRQHTFSRDEFFNVYMYSILRFEFEDRLHRGLYNVKVIHPDHNNELE